MTPLPPPDLPLDANEADALEQRHPIIDDGTIDLPDEIARLDADPADVLDQHLTVPLDDDEWPT